MSDREQHNNELKWDAHDAWIDRHYRVANEPDASDSSALQWVWMLLAIGLLILGIISHI